MMKIKNGIRLSRLRISCNHSQRIRRAVAQAEFLQQRPGFTQLTTRGHSQDATMPSIGGLFCPSKRLRYGVGCQEVAESLAAWSYKSHASLNSVNNTRPLYDAQLG